MEFFHLQLGTTFFNFLVSGLLEVSLKANKKHNFIFISLRVHFASFYIFANKGDVKEWTNIFDSRARWTLRCRRAITSPFVDVCGIAYFFHLRFLLCSARLAVNYFPQKHTHSTLENILTASDGGAWRTTSMEIVFLYGGRLILFFFLLNGAPQCNHSGL